MSGSMFNKVGLRHIEILVPKGFPSPGGACAVPMLGSLQAVLGLLDANYSCQGMPS